MNYELTGAKWGAPAIGTPGGLVTYSFVTQPLGTEPVDFTGHPLTPEYQSEVRDAFAQWSQSAGIGFAEVPDSSASQIRVGWEPIDGEFRTVGETYWAYRDGQLQQAWIGFDEGESWMAGMNGPELPNGFDFEAVALHEIGHAIGLGHYDAEPAAMNSVGSVEALQPSDVAGALALYGTPTAPVAVAAAGSASAPVSADPQLLTTLPDGAPSHPDVALEGLLAAAARPGFDHAMAEGLGVADGATERLGERLAALAADPGLGHEHAAAAILAEFPELETALSMHSSNHDPWFA